MPKGEGEQIAATKSGLNVASSEAELTERVAEIATRSIIDGKLIQELVREVVELRRKVDCGGTKGPFLCRRGTQEYDMCRKHALECAAIRLRDLKANAGLPL